MAAAKGMGLVKLPCFIGETEPGLKRLDLATQPSKWGIWMLYHADLRETARVRVCKEFLEDIVQQKRSVFYGEKVTNPF